MSNKTKKDICNKLAFVNIGYKKKIVCIVLSKSKIFHESYNVYAENKTYCLRRESITLF